jgi:hypothetical protein
MTKFCQFCVSGSISCAVHRRNPHAIRRVATTVNPKVTGCSGFCRGCVDGHFDELGSSNRAIEMLVHTVIITLE